MKQKKLILIILDSVGVGELSSADKFGDQGTNIISNIVRAIGDLQSPNLTSLRLDYGLRA